MKPKNKEQERVLALSKKLRPITEVQARWGYKNCIEHMGRRTARGAITCLECGHSWTDTTKKPHCVCLNCQTKLTICDTKQRVFNDYQYLCVITACEEFQVLRFIYIDYKAKAGEKARYFHSEVVQRWIAPNGSYLSFAKLRPMGFFVHAWLFDCPLEIRPDKPLYNVIPTCTYPHQQLIPEVKRSGYSGQFYGLTPFDLFHFILTNHKAETLIKAGQTNLLKFFANKAPQSITAFWASIRICIRNSYKVEDASMWCDYINLLRFMGKDLHNAKYVCPTDLQLNHDLYMRKKRDYQERERKEQAKKKALESEAQFQEMKAKFFGIQFTDGLIQVRMLESVEEVMLEGDALHHCVFTNEYHLLPDSLILSACIGEEKLETVEVSLTKLQVVQSRGRCNQNTEYHDRIVGLVNKNIREIRKRMVA